MTSDLSCFKMREALNESLKIIKFIHSESSKSQKLVFHNTVIGGTFETASFIDQDSTICNICVSVMAGCSMGCKICGTTYVSDRFERVLSADEIVTQICRALLKRPENLKQISSLRIGLMGNGESFANIDNVVEAIEKFSSISPLPILRFNISTIGVNLEKIIPLIDTANKLENELRLQYSLITRDDSVRHTLLPKAEKQCVAIPYFDRYALSTKTIVKYNVPLIKGINDSEDCLKLLGEFILEKPHLRILGLSTYHTFPNCPYKASLDNELIIAANYISTNFGFEPIMGFSHREILGIACGTMRCNS